MKMIITSLLATLTIIALGGCVDTKPYGLSNQGQFWQDQESRVKPGGA